MRRLARGEQGSALVEFAVVLPLLLLILFGIFDFGFLFQKYEVVTNAAREGARIGVLPGYATADVQARVNGYLLASGLTTAATTTVSTVTIDPGTGAPAFQGVTVTVKYPYTYSFIGAIGSMFGGGSFGTISLNATSTMRSEVAAAAGS